MNWARIHNGYERHQVLMRALCICILCHNRRRHVAGESTWLFRILRQVCCPLEVTPFALWPSWPQCPHMIIIAF